MRLTDPTYRGGKSECDTETSSMRRPRLTRTVEPRKIKWEKEMRKKNF